MPKIFIISDTHFNHANVIPYCDRPFKDVAEMNEELIRRWNEVVAPCDIVYHCGDFILGDPKTIYDILPRLNGKIILTRGNHDSKAKRAIYAEFPEKIQVSDIEYLEFGGLFFIFCHFPITNEEFIKMVKEDNSEVVIIHGHVHEKTPFEEDPEAHVYNVSADAISFTPMPINLIHALVKKDFVEKGVWRGE